MIQVIRRAEPTDAPALTSIAFTSKRHWRYPERWIEFWRPALTITEGYVAAHEIWAVVEAGEIAGFYALGEPGIQVELEHLWVSPEYLGLGLGKALFDHAAARAREIGGQVLVVESDPNAEGFYRHMGAMRVGERLSMYEDLVRVLPLMQFDLTPVAQPKAAQSQIDLRQPAPDR
ncbi:MAG: GNAT family N-acetyltransferase [Caldilineales bacterium]|nr:GNAT family N-acetyltransferase [Caldilineales bacterium]